MKSQYTCIYCSFFFYHYGVLPFIWICCSPIYILNRRAGGPLAKGCWLWKKLLWFQSQDRFSQNKAHQSLGFHTNLKGPSFTIFVNLVWCWWSTLLPARKLFHKAINFIKLVKLDPNISHEHFQLIANLQAD